MEVSILDSLGRSNETRVPIAICLIGVVLGGGLGLVLQWTGLLRRTPQDLAVVTMVVGAVGYLVGFLMRRQWASLGRLRLVDERLSTIVAVPLFLIILAAAIRKSSILLFVGAVMIVLFELFDLLERRYHLLAALAAIVLCGVTVALAFTISNPFPALFTVIFAILAVDQIRRSRSERNRGAPSS